MNGWPVAPFRVSILGVPVDVVTREAVDAWLRTVMIGTDDPVCRHLVTLNPEYVMAAARDDAFRRTLRGADLATPDGVGVSIAMRLLYPAHPRIGPFDRVTGVDVTEMVARISAEHGEPVFLLGAGAGVARSAAQKLMERHAGFVLAGTWDGGTPKAIDDGESRARVGRSGAKVVLVAYGAPAQIHWIARNQASLAHAGVQLVVGVGGALDFISGTVRRAPPWVRRMGLEWLYRLLREPWRWRRHLVLPRFALRVAVLAVQERFRAKRSAAPGV